MHDEYVNDPKYTVRDGKLWHRQGKYHIPDEEPVIVLRGKDPIALRMLRLYLECGPDDSHRESMTERIEAFRSYQEKYPARTRQGCHLHKPGE